MFGRRILVLIPHPDDEVVGCAAAILRARAQGAEAFGHFLTTGIPAAEVLWAWQSHRRRVRRRRKEAEKAAALLGLQAVGFEDVPTRGLKDTMAETSERITAAVSQHNPDTIWAPAYEGGHTDHDVTNFLASTFRERLAVWEFSEYNYAGGRARSQEFPATNGSEQAITLTLDERERKQKLLRLYQSEQKNLGLIRTAQEVFRPLAAYDYSRPPHEGKLFYERFQWVPFRHPRVDFTKPEEVCAAIRRFHEGR